MKRCNIATTRALSLLCSESEDLCDTISLTRRTLLSFFCSLAEFPVKPTLRRHFYGSIYLLLHKDVVMPMVVVEVVKATPLTWRASFGVLYWPNYLLVVVKVVEKFELAVNLDSRQKTNGKLFDEGCLS